MKALPIKRLANLSDSLTIREQHSLDGTHLVTVRGIIHQEVSTRVRQRGELN